VKKNADLPYPVSGLNTSDEKTVDTVNEIGYEGSTGGNTKDGSKGTDLFF
jgi:hypothetical protein